MRKNQSGPPAHSTSSSSRYLNGSVRPDRLELVRDDAVVDARDRRLARRRGGRTACARAWSPPRCQSRARPTTASVTSKSGRVFWRAGSISMSTTWAGSCAIEHRAADRRDVLFACEVPEEHPEVVQPVRLPRRLGQRHLEAIERRERLQLDEPAFEPGVRPDQPEVDTDKRRAASRRRPRETPAARSRRLLDGTPRLSRSCRISSCDTSTSRSSRLAGKSTASRTAGTRCRHQPAVRPRV